MSLPDETEPSPPATYIHPPPLHPPGRQRNKVTVSIIPQLLTQRRDHDSIITVVADDGIKRNKKQTSKPPALHQRLQRRLLNDVVCSVYAAALFVALRLP